MMIAIPYWEGDKALAKKLIDLIVGMQTERAGNEVEFLLVYRQDSKIDPQMLTKLRTRFNAQGFQSTSPFRGWPQGCNGMFSSTMIHICQHNVNCSMVYWMEADCVPMRPSWYKELLEAWRKRAPTTKVMGWMGDCNGNGTGVHITGCAMYDAKIVKIIPRIVTSCVMAWDYEHRDAIVGVGERTSLIENAYKSTGATQATLDLPFAVIHGFKDESLLNLVAQKYVAQNIS